MKKMIMTEADERALLIRRARAKYITTGKTKNISEAVRWYIDAHPEKAAGIPATITTRETDRPRTILDEYERPQCPNCGAPLFLKTQCSGMGRGDRITVWICVKCKYKDYSEKNIQEWLAELPRKSHNKPLRR